MVNLAYLRVDEHNDKVMKKVLFIAFAALFLCSGCNHIFHYAILNHNYTPDKNNLQLRLHNEQYREIRTVTDIGRAKPLIDWRYVLREAIKYDVDWSYRNAYIEDGVVSANLEEQPMPETEIVLDTSGSINEVLLKNFLRECKNILQHSRVKVGCFDTEFYGFHEIRTEEDIENMRFQGGGGTDFDVAVGAFSRRVENKIIFTDGKASMPEKPMDAIWIVFGGTRINPKGGKVIQIDDEQLYRLYSYQQDSSYKGRSR